MLRFVVFQNGAPAKSLDLEGAHLLGEDGVPLRSEVRLSEGVLVCDTRARGPVSLAILWPVEGYGRVMLETTRLLERREPYNLHVELARGRLTRISQKREDWGLFDFADAEALCKEVDQARAAFVEALAADNPHAAAKHADRAIATSMTIGEQLGTFHAEVFLKRRRATNQLGKRVLGCGITSRDKFEPIAARVAQHFDFVNLSVPWREVEPREGARQFAAIDAAAAIAKKHKIPVRGTDVLCFEKDAVPDWATSCDQDFDRLRGCIANHLKSVMTQYGPHFAAWEIVNGIHAFNAFHLQFEQLMDLTRLGATAVKQLAPRSTAIIGITLPWGEYYARDQRTIPPMLYADMVVRGGVNFDAFSLEIRFGASNGVLYTRDLMQVSSMLDKYGNLGKPLHVTAAGIPSAPPPGSQWTEASQAVWLRDFCRVALSKPFVETVSIHDLIDPAANTPTGLLRTDLAPKPAFEQIALFKRELTGTRTKTR